MKLGIIGMSGAGKSTVFEALTGIKSANMALKNEDRVGAIRVPDLRVDTLSKMYQPKKTIYAQVEYFLPGYGKKDDAVWSKLRTCDAFVNVVRNFKAYGLENPNPTKDFTTLDEEMILNDLVIVEKRIERLQADKQRGKAVDAEEIEIMNQCHQMLEKNTPIRSDSNLAQVRQLKGFALLTAKPSLVLFNNDDYDESMPDISSNNVLSLVIRGKLEQELCQMSPDEATEFLKEFNISESAMDRVIKASYSLLGLVSFFTVGEDEVRAWTIRKDTLADDAAGTIHTDFKKGFIRAEVLAYNDLIDSVSYNEARKKGLVRLEGKTYTVKDGDIINFRFNV